MVSILVMLLVELAFAKSLLGAKPEMKSTEDKIQQLCDRAAKLKDTEATQKVAVEGLNRFGLSLYAKSIERSGNILLSPLSISLAFAMTEVGAKGETAKELEKLFGFDSDKNRFDAGHLALIAAILCRKDSASQLKIANALWKQKGTDFLPEYAKRVKENLNGMFAEVDFTNRVAAAKRINDWTSKETQKKIETLLNPEQIPPETRLVLTNAVYFKAAWEQAFEKAKTKPGDFFLSDGHSKKVAMMKMTTEGDSASYMENTEVQLVELAFKNFQQSFILILPKEKKGLPRLEKGLTAEKVMGWVGKAEPSSVALTLPKFKLAVSYQLPEKLRALGLLAPFDPARADFSGIDGGAGALVIGDVIHKTYLDLNEEGAEAAAATAILMLEGAAMPPVRKKVVFTADHPFFFAIRDRATDSLLFIGRMSDPS